jgi:hypothetical protein
MHVFSIKFITFRSQRHKEIIENQEERKGTYLRMRVEGFYLYVLEHTFVARICDDIEHIVRSNGNGEAGVDLTEGAVALRDGDIGKLPWVL